MTVFITIALLQTALFWNEFVYGAPTFGDEYVHIKVHIPKEDTASINTFSHGHGPLIKPPVQVVPPHKVIHHFHHRRRRPFKKGHAHKHQHSKYNGLLESIILSEVHQPSISGEHLKYLNHAGDIAKHVVKPVETYILEHADPQPKDHVDTFAVVEDSKETLNDDHGTNYNHPTEESLDWFGTRDAYKPHHQLDYNSSPPSDIDTVKVIDAKQPYFTDETDYSNGHKPTHPLVTSVVQRPYHTEGGYHYVPKKPQVNTVQVDVTKHFSHPHYKHQSQLAVEDADYHTTAAEYQHNSRPEHSSHDEDISYDTDTLEVAKTKEPGYSFHDDYYQVAHHQSKPGSGYHYERPSSSAQLRPPHVDADFGPHYGGEPNKINNHFHSADNTYTNSEDQESPQDSYLPPKRYSTQHLKEQVNQNTLFDGESHDSTESDGDKSSYLPPVETNVDWPTAIETYKGMDSYSAAHVQGVGSGGYHYPPPYL